jgi:hypothetical protein
LKIWPWIGLEQVLLSTSLAKQPQAKQLTLDHKEQQRVWMSIYMRCKVNQHAIARIMSLNGNEI